MLLTTRAHYAGTSLALVLLALGALALGGPQPVAAQGGGIPPSDIWIPPDRIAPSPIITRNLHLLRYAADVKIANGIATTRVSLDFRNDTPNQLEGDFVFPVPKGAILSDFALRDGEHRLNPELLDVDTARNWYLEIVRQAIDPGLLEYIDQSAYRVRAFPFAPGQTRTIEISFAQTLPTRGNLRLYSLPLQFAMPNINLIRNLQMLNEAGVSAERAMTYQPAPTPQFVATINCSDDTGLGAISSPTHTLAVSRTGANTAYASVEAPLNSAHFQMLLGRATEAFAASILTYPGEGKEDGYFTATIYPVTRADQAALPKDVVLVLDTSGSMDGEKWQQARGALKFVIDHLGADDRLALIDYDDIVNQAWDGLQVASGANRQSAHAYLSQLGAAGGTNIHDALQRGAQIVAGSNTPNRPDYLLFFTDGLATVGNTDSAAILRMMDERLPKDARLFTFGVGYDVNTQLLDSLARDHKGASDYVEPSQNIEAVVSAFYQKIQNPALTDITLDWGGLDAYDILPERLPDLFQGTQVTISGRYRGTAPDQINLTIKGRAGDQSRTIPLTLPARPDRSNTFVPRLWANLRIGRLMEHLQANQGNTELITEIRQLAQRYGIVTPYTSYLVREDMRFNPQAQLDSVRERSDSAPMSGFSAVQQSKSENKRQSAGGNEGAFEFSTDELNEEDRDAYDRAQAPPSAAPMPAEPSTANGLPQQFMNQVGNLTFLQAGIGMVDSRLDPAATQQVIQIAAFSERYLTLLEAFPELGPILAQSSEVSVQVAPSIVLQTVLVDDTGQPVQSSQVNALRAQPNSRTPENYRSASTAEWNTLTDALKTGYFRG